MFYMCRFYFRFSPDDEVCRLRNIGINNWKMIHLLFVLLFLYRIRRSRCQNLPEYLRQKYGQQTLLSYRRLETTVKKQRKADLDSEFLLYCQVNHVIPNFIKFKLYRQSLHHSFFIRMPLQNYWIWRFATKKSCRRNTSKQLLDYLICCVTLYLFLTELF